MKKADKATNGEAVRVRMLVGPEQAEKWLARNTHNRPLREITVFRYASDMEAGLWQYNYAAVLIARDGTLIDGQHRLKACVLAGVPFDTDVVFGADLSVQRYIDGGQVRTAADQGALAGIKNAHRAAAVSLMILMHDTYGIQNLTNCALRPSRASIEQFMLDNDEEVQASLVGGALLRLCAPRVTDFCSFLFRRQNQEKAERFFMELGDGNNMSRPVQLLRDRLMFNWRSKAKLPPRELITLFFKAWIAFRDGKPIGCLKVSSGDSFPTI